MSCDSSLSMCILLVFERCRDIFLIFWFEKKKFRESCETRMYAIVRVIIFQTYNAIHTIYWATEWEVKNLKKKICQAHSQSLAAIEPLSWLYHWHFLQDFKVLQLEIWRTNRWGKARIIFYAIFPSTHLSPRCLLKWNHAHTSHRLLFGCAFCFPLVNLSDTTMKMCFFFLNLSPISNFAAYLIIAVTNCPSPLFENSPHLVAPGTGEDNIYTQISTFLLTVVTCISVVVSLSLLIFGMISAKNEKKDA